METWETVYIDILKRLQDICIQSGTDMWLYGRTALSAFRDGRLSESDVEVCVHAKDAINLEKAVRAAADGTIDVESPLSNERYPDYELRVFDPRTTDCNASNFFKYDNNCMHVTVKLMGQPVRRQSKAEKLLGKLGKKFSGPTGAFEKWCASQSGNANILQISKQNYKSELFEKGQTVELYGNGFSIPADADAFFTAQFGPGWQYIELPEFESGKNHFIDPERRWSDLAGGIADEEIRAYVKALKEYREGSASHRDAQKVLTRVHNIVDQSYDRIQAYKALAGREDELKELVKADRFDELEAEMRPYLSKLKKYRDIGMDLYVDDALSDLTDVLLRHNGMGDFADDIRNLIPAERDEIVLTDHHGEPLAEIPRESAANSAGKDFDPYDPPEGILSETQIRLLDMMKRVHAFLSENGIEYFLFGGSLLGAVRHNGFIPWDDDMDIVMDRANYEKLIAASDRLPWDDIAFDCCEKNPAFHKPFGMFTLLTDTRYVNDRVYFGGAGLGTGIDVFIMDNVPWESLDEYIRNSLLYQEIQTDETIKCADIFKYKEEYFECKKREAAGGKEAEVARLRAEMEKYGPKKDDDLQVVRLWARKPRIYQPGMMEKPVLHRFEDAEFPIPEKAVECLEMQYGSDWNVIPPHEGRKVHAFKIDYDLAAVNYYRLVDKAVDWSEVSEALSARKKSRVRILDKKQATDAFRKTLYQKHKDN